MAKSTQIRNHYSNYSQTDKSADGVVLSLLTWWACFQGKSTAKSYREVKHTDIIAAGNWIAEVFQNLIKILLSS